MKLANEPFAPALGIEAEILFLPLYFGKKRLQRKARPRPAFWRGNAPITTNSTHNRQHYFFTGCTVYTFPFTELKVVTNPFASSTDFAVSPTTVIGKAVLILQMPPDPELIVATVN